MPYANESKEKKTKPKKTERDNTGEDFQQLDEALEEYGAGVSLHDERRAPLLSRRAAGLKGEMDGLNLFRMDGNNPVSMRDIVGQIPQIAHYIWLGGGSISNDSISNIIDFKKNNPPYSVNLWVENVNVMKNTLIERGYSSKLFDLINIKEIDRFDTETESAVARENADSPLKNYAAASDIIRLAILYKYGGLYMDVDVLINGPLGELTSERKSKNRPPSILVYGLQDPEGYNYANAMIASVCEAPEILKMLRYATSPYNGYISEMGFAITAGISGVHHLADSAQAMGTSLDEIMWATKRHDRNVRFDATIMVTGPGVMSSFIDASGLSSRMAKIKIFSKEIVNKAGERIDHLGTWDLGFNGVSNWAFKVPLHSTKANEV